MLLTVITFIISLFSGYTFFLYLSHPAKKKHKVPHVKIKNIEILPNLKIHYRSTTFWIHHWILLSALAITSFIAFEGMHLAFLKGAAIGGVLQGLRYKDRFHIRNKRIR